LHATTRIIEEQQEQKQEQQQQQRSATLLFFVFKSASTMKQPNQKSSPLSCEIVTVDGGRYFRKQSVDSSEQGTYFREKKEAQKNARTFAADDKGWRNDAALRKRREEDEEEDDSNGEDDFDGKS